MQALILDGHPDGGRLITHLLDRYEASLGDSQQSSGLPYATSPLTQTCAKAIGPIRHGNPTCNGLEQHSMRATTRSSVSHFGGVVSRCC